MKINSPIQRNIRIQNELKMIQHYPSKQWHIQKINQIKWQCIFTCNPLYPYSGSPFSVDIDFPQNYPYSPPVLTIASKDRKRIFHPNIRIDGLICDSYLNKKQQSISVRQRIQNFLGLLMIPNPGNPWNTAAAELYQKDNRKFKQRAKAIYLGAQKIYESSKQKDQQVLKQEQAIRKMNNSIIFEKHFNFNNALISNINNRENAAINTNQQTQKKKQQKTQVLPNQSQKKQKSSFEVKQIKNLNLEKEKKNQKSQEISSFKKKQQKQITQTRIMEKSNKVRNNEPTSSRNLISRQDNKERYSYNSTNNFKYSSSTNTIKIQPIEVKTQQQNGNQQTYSCETY